MSVRRVQHARSSIAGAVPAAADVLVGELIINFADRTIRTKNGANALIRLNQNLLFSATPPADPVSGDAYIDSDTQLLYIYADFGSGIQWTAISPPESLGGFLPLTGGSMSGQITLPGGGTANQALQKSEIETLIAAAVVPYLLKSGGTMTGHITMPAVDASGNQVVRYNQMAAAIAAAVPPDLSLVVLKTGSTMSGQLTLPGGGAGNQAPTVNELAAAIASHAAQPDPHTAYTLSTELNAHIAAGGAQHPAATGSVNGFMIAADKARLDTMSLASQAEAEAGTDNLKYMSSLRVKQAINISLGNSIQTLTDASPIVWNMATANNAIVTMGASRTLSAPTGEVTQREGYFDVVMGGAGGWTLTWNGAYKGAGGGVPDAPSKEAGAVTRYKYYVRGADDIVVQKIWVSNKNSIGFFKEYDLGAYNDLANTSVAHNLGRQPALVMAILECTVIDQGWVVGDRIWGHNGTGSGANSIGFQVYASTTVAGIIATNTLQLVHKTTFTLENMVEASWKVLIRVYE